MRSVQIFGHPIIGRFISPNQVLLGGIFLLIVLLALLGVLPVSADGGGPEPTDTPIPTLTLMPVISPTTAPAGELQTTSNVPPPPAVDEGRENPLDVVPTAELIETTTTISGGPSLFSIALLLLGFVAFAIIAFVLLRRR